MAAERANVPGELDSGLVLAELWTSFVSLLRAYLAGAEAYLPAGASRSAMTVSPEGETVVITATRYLTLDPGVKPDGTGTGYWALYDGAPDPDRLLGDGGFRMHLDSTVEWTAVPGRLSMEEVAEALTTMLGNPDPKTDLDAPEEAEA